MHGFRFGKVWSVITGGMEVAADCWKLYLTEKLYEHLRAIETEGS